eukprot:227534_1
MYHNQSTSYIHRPSFIYILHNKGSLVNGEENHARAAEIQLKHYMRYILQHLYFGARFVHMLMRIGCIYMEALSESTKQYYWERRTIWHCLPCSLYFIINFCGVYTVLSKSC